MATPNNISKAVNATKGPTTNNNVVAGTNTPWHHVVLWFLGGVALIALADPAPGIATALVLLIIMGTLLNNWSIYKTYLGIK